MNNSVNNEIITFYDVPLVCGAAPAIGCGSRAKPLLIDLEQQTAVEEAWLNRRGAFWVTRRYVHEAREND